MERKSFLFYASYYEAIDTLPDELQLELYEAIAAYALTGRLQEFENPACDAVFSKILPKLQQERRAAQNATR